MNVQPRVTLTLKKRIAKLEQAAAPRPALKAVPTPEPASKRAPFPAHLNNRYFFIWCPDGNRPSRRHETVDTATAEAARLKTLEPHRDFLVYEARLVGTDSESAGNQT